MLSAPLGAGGLCVHNGFPPVPVVKRADAAGNEFKHGGVVAYPAPCARNSGFAVAVQCSQHGLPFLRARYALARSASEPCFAGRPGFVTVPVVS